MHENICISCFQDKGGGNVCPHCGYAESGARKRGMLPVRYVLHGQYMIGEALSSDRNCICYKALDMQQNRIVEVQEHFPREIVSRAHDSAELVPIAEQTEWPGKGVQTIYQNAQRMMDFAGSEGLLHIFDTFLENNTVYIVNEYLEGLLLEDYLRQCGGNVDVDTALSIVIPILNGLGQLHKAGLIHRAVTPKNILISTDNSIKLINCVFLKEASSYKENEMTVYFSPGYAPYEQYVSRERRGAYTDIYSVGAVLYRMLMGKAPADAVLRKNSSHNKEGDAIRASLEETMLPEYLILAICKAMDMEKDCRYKKAADMKDALLQITPPVDIDGKLAKDARRKQIVTIVVLSAILTALLVIAGVLIHSYW